MKTNSEIHATVSTRSTAESGWRADITGFRVVRTAD